MDTRRGPGRASGRGGGPPYAGPLPQREPPSPAQSRRTTITHPPQHHQFDTLESNRRPSVSKMHRTASTADISEYKINEGAIKLLSVSDLILLIASLVMVATGKSIYFHYTLFRYLSCQKSTGVRSFCIFMCTYIPSPTYLILLLLEDF